MFRYEIKELVISLLSAVNEHEDFATLVEKFSPRFPFYLKHSSHRVCIATFWKASESGHDTSSPE